MMTPPASTCDPALLPLLDAICAERLGKADLRGAALAEAVQRVSACYLRASGSPRELQGDSAALCARLKFFLPRDLPKIKAPLAELAAVSAFPIRPTLRVLDLGAGLGATGLGAAEFALTLPGITAVELDALDVDRSALAIAERVIGGWARTRGLPLRFKAEAHALTPAALTHTRPPYDLIVAGFVFNELVDTEPDPVAFYRDWLLRLSDLLAPDGALCVLEPALRPISRTLQQVRGELASCQQSPFVFAPCLHAGACPLLLRERDWCHQELPLSFPPALAAIAHAAGLRDDGPTYSYLTLHKALRSLAELAHAEGVYRIVSGALPSKGKLEFMLCGDHAPTRLRRLDRNRAEPNRALDALPRGAIVQVEPAPQAGADRVEVAAGTTVRTLLQP